MWSCIHVLTSVFKVKVSFQFSPPALSSNCLVLLSIEHAPTYNCIHTFYLHKYFKWYIDLAELLLWKWLVFLLGYGDCVFHSHLWSPGSQLRVTEYTGPRGIVRISMGTARMVDWWVVSDPLWCAVWVKKARAFFLFQSSPARYRIVFSDNTNCILYPSDLRCTVLPIMYRRQC